MHSSPKRKIASSSLAVHAKRMNKRIRKKKAKQKDLAIKAELKAWCLSMDAKVSRFYHDEIDKGPFVIVPTEDLSDIFAELGIF